jgi:hypothetical protein
MKIKNPSRKIGARKLRDTEYYVAPEDGDWCLPDLR